MQKLSTLALSTAPNGKRRTLMSAERVDNENVACFHQVVTWEVDGQGSVSGQGDGTEKSQGPW